MLNLGITLIQLGRIIDKNNNGAIQECILINKTMNLKLGQVLTTLQTSKLTEIPKYAEEQINIVKEEIKRLNEQIKKLNEQNKREANSSTPEIQACRKARLALFLDQVYRIKRFLLIYYNFRCNRIEDQFWIFGGDINNTQKGNLSENEKGYFSNYKSLVMEYGQAAGIDDLAIDLQPPLTAEVEVRMLKDCGEVLNESRQVIKLQKNASFFINRKLIEPYVKQGYAVIKRQK